MVLTHHRLHFTVVLLLHFLVRTIAEIILLLLELVMLWDPFRLSLFPCGVETLKHHVGVFRQHKTLVNILHYERWIRL